MKPTNPLLTLLLLGFLKKSPWDRGDRPCFTPRSRRQRLRRPSPMDPPSFSSSLSLFYSSLYRFVLIRSGTEPYRTVLSADWNGHWYWNWEPWPTAFIEAQIILLGSVDIRISINQHCISPATIYLCYLWCWRLILPFILYLCGWLFFF